MNDRINGFDYLKIIAASIIVLHHYQQDFGCTFAGVNFYEGRIAFGYLVELFFIISGFLTYYTEYKHTSSHVAQRLIHKFVRIYPMTFFSIAVCLLIRTGLSLTQNDGDILKLWSPGNILVNFGLLFSGYSAFERQGINNPVWYVCVLFQCYAVFFLLEWIFRKRKTQIGIMVRSCAYIVVIIFSVFAFWRGILNVATFRGLVSFFIGVGICCINEYLKDKSFINEENHKLISLMLFVFMLLSNGIVLLGVNFRWVFLFFIFPLLVWGVAILEVPDVEIISKFGDISFEVYLMHDPLIYLVKLIAQITKITINHSYITMIIFLLLSWIVSWMLWKYIDLPFRKKIRCRFGKTPERR